MPVSGAETTLIDAPPPARAALRLAWRQRPASALGAEGELAAAWDGLNAGRGNPVCLSAHCVATAVAALGDGTERLLLGHQGPRLVAAFVLTGSARVHERLFQPSQLPLGAWVADARLSLEAVAGSLLRSAALRLPALPMLSLSVTRIDPWVAPREADLADNRHADYIETAWVDLTGTLDGYWAARGKNLRQNMRKQRNRLAAEGVVPRTRKLTQAADMAAAVERYGRLESGGWKAVQGSAVSADNVQGRFYRQLLEGAADRGEAVVYEHLFDERSVAINLCLQHRSTIVILKTTYDESIKSYSPAFLLHQDMIEDLFTVRAIDRIEYFGQVMDWHTKWTANKRALHHLTLYRFSWLKLAASAIRARRRQQNQQQHAEEPTE